MLRLENQDGIKKIEFKNFKTLDEMNDFFKNNSFILINIETIDISSIFDPNRNYYRAWFLNDSPHETNKEIE